MNQTNQQWGESQHHTLWFEAKIVYENLSKRQDCVLNRFNEGKNYNPFAYVDSLIGGDFWRIMGNVGIPVKHDYLQYKLK